MLNNLFRLNLQLFADGGDGGDGGSSSAATGEGAGLGNSGEDIEDDVPAFIPEKAKENYRKAMRKMKNGNRSQESQGIAYAEQTTDAQTDGKMSYEDMIASDDYKEAHQKYMEKTIGDRLKKYKGMEADYGKAREALEIVAGKYELDPSSETFLDDLTSRIHDDDIYYENYALEHDVSPDEAKRIVALERQVQRQEQEKRIAERERATQEVLQRLNASAQQTKARFPEFDLETELADERFKNILKVNNGDTTSAYIACHYNEVFGRVAASATQQANARASAAVASNMRRPVEAGLSSQAPSVMTMDFRGMNKQQLDAYAAEMRRQQARRR